MDNEKDKEINFKPSNWLYIFLFVYYSVWLMQSFGALSHYFTFGFDSFLKYGTVEWLCFVLFIIAGAYSFYAVIKTLRGDKDCMTSLKWSLVLVFIYTLMDPIRAQIPTYDLLTYCVAYFMRPLFYLIFCLYLCFAKGIKRRFPNSERKFGPSGWVWVGLMAAFVGVGIYGGWHQSQISNYCKRVDVESLNLSPGHVSDGYVLFTSDRKWQKWSEPSDTLYIEDRIETLPTIMSEDSLSRIYIASGHSEIPDARTYNQVLVASLGSISANSEVEWGKLKEISFTDSIISGKRLFSTIYETSVNSVPAYFDVVMVSELKSPKCCIIIRSDKNPIDRDWAFDFADGLKFDLQNVSKSENDKDGGNSKNNKSHGTAQCKQEANPNMPATLLHGIRPCHLFGIVTLKNNERQIADRKCNYVFYNL